MEQIQATCFLKSLTLTLSMIMSAYLDSKGVHIPWLNVNEMVLLSNAII